MLTVKTLPLVIAILVVTTAVFAAVTITYLTDSTLDLETIEAPVQYLAPDETSNRYLSGWTLSANKTYFTATVKGVPEVNLTIDHLFKIRNQDTAAHSVTLSIPGVVSDADVEFFKIQIVTSGGAHVKMWDLKSSASVNLASMPATTTYHAKVIVHLATGAGNHNVGESLAVSLAVT